MCHLLKLLADDSKTFAPISDATDGQKVQLNLSDIKKWSRQNHLHYAQKIS